LECLPASELPPMLTGMGWEVRPAGVTTRIPPAGVCETFIDDRREKRHRDHAGLAEVLVYEMPMRKP
jgi:hypothetical protein